MPETLHMHSIPAETGPDIRDDGQAVAVRTWSHILKREIIVGLLAVFLSQMRYNVLQILPPFLSVKFDWSIAEVTTGSHKLTSYLSRYPLTALSRPRISSPLCLELAL
jgi:hypothetical protein